MNRSNSGTRRVSTRAQGVGRCQRSLEESSEKRFLFLVKAVPRLVSMSENEMKGKGRQVKGIVREEVGKLTNNKTEQVKGKVEQAEGKARENLGKAQRRAGKD